MEQQVLRTLPMPLPPPYPSVPRGAGVRRAKDGAAVRRRTQGGRARLRLVGWAADAQNAPRSGPGRGNDEGAEAEADMVFWRIYVLPFTVTSLMEERFQGTMKGWSSAMEKWNGFGEWPRLLGDTSFSLYMRGGPL